MFTLKEIVDITAGEPIYFKPGLKIEGISTDSRKIKGGELFIAIKGDNFDGADFVDDARKKGAAAALVSKVIKAEPDFPLIKVKDATKALGGIAGLHRERFNIPVIAITGSNGKTTTKDMVAHILGAKFKVLKTGGTENNQIGVPLTVFKLKDQDFAVLEMGTNSPGEIEYNCSILKPTIAVITNIGPSHLEKLKDISSVAKEKLSLIKSLPKAGTWVRNADDNMLAGRWFKDIKIIDYGINKTEVDFNARNIKQAKNGIEFTLTAPDSSMGHTIYLPIFGVHNVYNALAAIATCLNFVDIKIIKEALSGFKGLHMRMEVLNGDGFTIINDSYNSNPSSFKCAVSTLKSYPSPGKRIMVAADMLELGDNSKALHYESGKSITEEGIDLLITFGELASGIARGAIDSGMDKRKVSVFSDKNDIVRYLRNIVNNGDVVLIKGSRRMKMEEIVDCFTTCSTH